MIEIHRLILKQRIELRTFDKKEYEDFLNFILKSLNHFRMNFKFMSDLQTTIGVILCNSGLKLRKMMSFGCEISYVTYFIRVC